MIYSIRKLIKFADLFSIGNCIFGFLAIIYFFNKEIGTGLICILISAFLDFVDGKIARKSGKCTEFGKSLDFADLVSFGIAPGILIYILIPNLIGYCVSIFYVTCSLLRLARFNITNTEYSIGLPITFSGLIFPIVFFIYPNFSEIVFSLTAIGLSFLMISSIKINKVSLRRLCKPSKSIISK